MGISKIVLNNELLLDLTGDTVTPADVREGVIFHGADGERKTGTMPPGVDVSGADAAAGDVLSGKKFVGANGELESGTMVNRGAVSQTLDGTTKTYTVPAGYHNGNGAVIVNTQTKSVTPKPTAQTVTPDGGYLLSSVSVGASSGKSVYTGSVTKSGGGSLSINVGTSVGSTDTFILVYDGSSFGGVTEIITHAIKKGTAAGKKATAIGDATDDGDATVNLAVNTSVVTYSGTTVTIVSQSGWIGTYSWYLIKA